jgi:hypothetical protein
MEGIGGWLLVYLIGSVPVTLFYAAGVAGRFFDYHLGVVAGVFLVLATPLALVVLKLASAPVWHIASLWVGTGSISLIVIAGALSADKARLGEIRTTMVAIICLSLIWAVVWTTFFLTYERVARTLPSQRTREDQITASGGGSFSASRKSSSIGLPISGNSK